MPNAKRQSAKLLKSDIVCLILRSLTEIFMIVAGATHMKMYYKPQYVEKAVKKLDEFYKRYLK